MIQAQAMGVYMPLPTFSFLCMLERLQSIVLGAVSEVPFIFNTPKITLQMMISRKRVQRASKAFTFAYICNAQSKVDGIKFEFFLL